MNFSRRHRAHSGVEASSLSDILFFLLIFFLMIATLASPDAIRLLLPQSTTAKNVPKKVIHLSVNAEKNYFVEGKPVASDQLESVLATQASTLGEQPSVVLRIDKANTVQDLVAVADVISRLNLHMVLATDKAK